MLHASGATVSQRFLKDELVRLVKPLPELQLHPGEIGVIRGSWTFPTPAYEVEFQVGPRPLRALLLEHHVAPMYDEQVSVAA